MGNLELGYLAVCPKLNSFATCCDCAKLPTIKARDVRALEKCIVGTKKPSQLGLFCSDQVDQFAEIVQLIIVL